MGNKSTKKKEYIIEKAREVFVSKGFKDVTMKDIVDACQISRGGLYLYFDSTEAVFKGVLAAEKNRINPENKAKMPENPTNTDILTFFFVEYKKEIINPDSGLLKAIYEYSLYQKETGHHTFMENQEKLSLRFLESVLKAGMDKGEFRKHDEKQMARHIFYSCEGMKILSRTASVEALSVDAEIVHIMKEILTDEKLLNSGQ